MSSNLRIGGLASGIDTESIIIDLMRAHRIPVDRLEQDRQILEWQQEDFREMNTLLRSFQDTASKMRLQSTYLAKSASSTNENVATTTANSNATPGSYAVTVHQLAEGVSKGSQVELTDEKDTDGSTKTLSEQFGLSETISFELEGANGSQVFIFNADSDNIFQVVSEINNADLGIKASYDSTQNRFFLASETTGAEQKINVLNDNSNFLSDDIGDGSGNKLGMQLKTGVDYTGQDAEIDFGDVTGLTSSTNSITVNGISMTLKTQGTSTISVSNNTDAVFDSIVSFIDKYNTTIKAITNKYYEESFTDYLPLTDEQREQLTDSQIEQWEEKARSGLLRRDPLLSGIMNSMRSTMSSVVSGLSDGFDALAEIGITTTYDYMDPQLVIDEDKLREALQNDPEGVMDLFTKSSDNYEEMGIAKRLYEDINNGIDKLMNKAGSNSNYSLVDNSFIGKEISEIDDRLETWEYRLQQMEDRYWNQFTAMEKAIQQLNSQSSWLAQQFGTS